MTSKERFVEIFRSQVTRPGAGELLAWLETTDFFEAPAGAKHHGAYPGGLVDHSLDVYDQLLLEPGALEYSGNTLAVCALLHDVCKAGVYHLEDRRRKNTDTGRWETYQGYVFRDPLPLGHGEKSVFLIQRHMDLTDEEALAIRWHMGAYDEAHRGGSRALGAAMDCCALVLALHQADIRASQEEKRRAPARGTPHPYGGGAADGCAEGV